MLVHEKADQAQALLEETGLDCWLIFARETGVRPDPGVELVTDQLDQHRLEHRVGRHANGSRGCSGPAACSLSASHWSVWMSTRSSPWNRAWMLQPFSQVWHQA